MRITDCIHLILYAELSLRSTTYVNVEKNTTFDCLTYLQMIRFEPRHEKICLRGLRPGTSQTGLLSYRDKLES